MADLVTTGAMALASVGGSAGVVALVKGWQRSRKTHAEADLIAVEAANKVVEIMEGQLSRMEEALKKAGEEIEECRQDRTVLHGEVNRLNLAIANLSTKLERRGR